MGDLNNIFSDIPVNWSVSKLKYFSSIYTGNSLNDAEKNKFSVAEDNLEGRVYISSKDINVHNNSCNYDTDLIIPYDETKYKVAPLGSSLLCIEGGSAGKKLTFTKQEVCFVNKLACFTGEDDESSKFIYYFLQSDGFKVQFNSSLSGLIGGVSLTNLNDFQVPIPPKQTQIRIASFLDKKTAEIDTIVEKKENLLLLLEEKKQAIINEAVTKGINPDASMKDSGIEWIGEIPAHWEVSKLKYYCSIQGRIGFKGYSKEDIVSEGEGAITIGAKHINKKNRLDLTSPEFLAWDKYYESPEIMVNKGDIIFTQRGTLGKVCIIEDEIGEATINPSMVILKAFSNINRIFLYNWLTSDFIYNNVMLIQSNTAVPMISQFQLGNFEILIPSLEDQLFINHFTNEINKLYDGLIEKVFSQIEKLKEYRQAIISEAVTGKLEIA